MTDKNVEQEQKPMNLYQKIQAVMKEIEYLQKDNHVQFGKTNYKAISEEKVTMAVRKALVKYGLVIMPIGQQYQRHGNLASVEVKYKIVDVDTGEYETITSVGEGADTQDKAAGKAMTYAYKYLLLRTFAIPTGEDPDKISSAELDESQKKMNENRKELENSINQSLLLLTQQGYNPQYIQQVCSQAIRPFNQLSELNEQELRQLKNLLEQNLPQPV